MNRPSFPGFPRELFGFLRELAAHNNRDWFNVHKDRYIDEVAEPVCDFIEAMEPRLHAISEHFVADPRRHGGSMFRIYRDARFTRDKRPYKEHAACQFRHEAGRDAHAPGFYVHIAPDDIRFGGGIWMPPAEDLFRIRSAIVEHAGEWERIRSDAALQQRFGFISGSGLKRVPRGFDSDHPHFEDLRRKTWFVMQGCDENLACSPAFIDEVEHAFRTAAPLLGFLTRAVRLPF